MTERLSYGIAEAGRLLGVSREVVRGLVKNGRLRTVKLGSRVVIPADSLTALLSEQE